MFIILQGDNCTLNFLFQLTVYSNNGHLGDSVILHVGEVYVKEPENVRVHFLAVLTVAVHFQR